MNITLDPDIQERINEKIRSGEFGSADEVVRQALQCFLGLDAGEIEETRAAIAEAMEQSRRGEAVSAEEVFDELRAKYGIPR
jgi:putative addiction module CopG family antidote